MKNKINYFFKDKWLSRLLGFGGKDNITYWYGKKTVDSILPPFVPQTPLKIGYTRPQSVLEYRQRVNVFRCAGIHCDKEPVYFDDMKNGYCYECWGQINI